jgi:hypothetical protein
MNKDLCFSCDESFLSAFVPSHKLAQKVQRNTQTVSLNCQIWQSVCQNNHLSPTSALAKAMVSQRFHFLEYTRTMRLRPEIFFSFFSARTGFVKMPPEY